MRRCLNTCCPKTETGIALLLSHNGATVVRLRIGKEISALAQDFLNDVKNEKPWKQSARALYDAVLGPIPNITDLDVSQSFRWRSALGSFRRAAFTFGHTCWTKRGYGVRTFSCQ